MSVVHGIVCPACSKSYPYKPELAGRKVKCKCGQVIAVAAPAAPRPAADAMEMAPAAPEPAKPKVDRDSLQSAIRQRMGIIPGKTSETKERERLEEHRKEHEARFQPNTMRDTIAPIILIVMGVVLLFVEVQRCGPHPISSPAAAFPIVVMRCIFAVGLMAAALFGARAFLDVTFAYSAKQSALRIIAIAIAPCAIYGICAAMVGASGSTMGDLTGAVVGVGVSLAIYTLLFMALMQLDTKDTAICVMMTWMAVALANYIAFRLGGMVSPM